jgi:hypothetical protein
MTLRIPVYLKLLVTLKGTGRCEVVQKRREDRNKKRMGAQTWLVWEAGLV